MEDIRLGFQVRREISPFGVKFKQSRLLMFLILCPVQYLILVLTLEYMDAPDVLNGICMGKKTL